MICLWFFYVVGSGDGEAGVCYEIMVLARQSRQHAEGFGTLIVYLQMLFNDSFGFEVVFQENPRTIIGKSNGIFFLQVPGYFYGKHV